MNDRRASRRVKVTIRARVSDMAGEEEVNCLLRDASACGCKLVANAVPYLPDRVRLTVDGLAAPIDARIVWRAGKVAGVRFLRVLPSHVLNRPAA